MVGDNRVADLLKRIGRRKIDVLILDESHRFKNRDSQRTQAVWGQECLGFGGIIEHAEAIYCLTGTAMPLNPMDVWPMLRAIAPDLIMTEKGRPMSYSAFQTRYCRTVNNGFGAKVAGNKNYKELKDKLFKSGFVMRRTRKEVFGRDLEPPTTLYVKATKAESAELAALESSPDGRRIKEALERGGLTALAKLEKGNTAKLRKLYGLAKVADLASIIADELNEEPDLKQVIGFHHRDVGKAYQLALKKFNPLVFDGSTPADRKIRMNKQFMSEKKYRVILAQMDAAEVGLDFSSADFLTIAEAVYVGKTIEQFSSRIFNMQNPNPKFIRFAALSGSTDAAIMAEAQSKLKMSDMIFG